MKRLILLCLLVVASAFPRWTPLAFRPADTGLVKADFTLVYQRWNYDATTTPRLTTTTMSTTGITVMEAGNGVYGFDGLDDDDLHFYFFRATVTSNGHRDERWIPWAGPAESIASSGSFAPSSTASYWQGDTPTYVVSVKTLDCHGAVAAFTLKRQDGNVAKTLTGTASVTNYGVTTGCDLAFAFTAADTSMSDCPTSPCSYYGQFTMTWAGSPAQVQSTDRYTIVVKKK